MTSFSAAYRCAGAGKMCFSSKATAEQLRLAHRGGAADSQPVHARPEQLLGGGMRAGGLSSPALQQLGLFRSLHSRAHCHVVVGVCKPGVYQTHHGNQLLDLHIRKRTFTRQ